MAKVLCVGLLCLDTIVRPVKREIFDSDTMLLSGVAYSTGGDALNQSIIFSRLGDEAYMAGMVGGDDAGRRIMRELEENGVDTSLMAVHQSVATPVSVLLSEENGERHVLYYPGTNSEFCFDAYDKLDGFDLVSAGSLFNTKKMDAGGYKELFRQAKARGIATAADFTADTLGADMDEIVSLFKYVDYLLPSRTEGEYVTGKSGCNGIIDELLRLGANTVVLKNGSGGCYVGGRGGIVHIPAYEDIEVVDTTGAGDNFTAAFLHALLKGRGMEESAKFACAAGAIAVGRVGAATALKDEQQVLNFMEKMGG